MCDIHGYRHHYSIYAERLGCICRRISGTQRGHNESVSRGQPSGGLDFSRDFSRGLSDHLGMKEGFSGTKSLVKQNIRHAPFAAIDIAFSRYLMG